MFSSEVIRLILSVLASWEVISVTLAVIVYLFLVFYVARLNRRPRRAAAPKQKKAAKKDAAPEPVEVEVSDDE